MHLLKIILNFLFLSSPAFAILINRTIDDTFGDEGIEAGINPDPVRAFNGTWTAAAYHPNFGRLSITLEFEGTAIYVFFIISHNSSSGCEFTLDGNTLPDQFNIRPASLLPNLEYSYPVFAHAGLENKEHALEIIIYGLFDVYINLDYVIYTVDESTIDIPDVPATTSHESATTPISPHESGIKAGIKPDPGSGFNGTWTAAFYSPDLKNITITLEFKAIAIYVFYIIAENTSTISSFTLDGELSPQIFLSGPTSLSSKSEYNHLALAHVGLENKEHTLEILTDGGFPFYMNFDYAVYMSVYQHIQSFQAYKESIRVNETTPEIPITSLQSASHPSSEMTLTSLSSGITSELIATTSQLPGAAP
ncbi:hypothetical protein AMATHDRAFT_2771 [Amanita thiersii Skay4041]|uniref:Uncharacterized protein n=1 Tax=Amanita thiersii Skay4041 TaxID=703135 RepID=A0A2A9NVG5_9AGAR|nr:hypothetical protein AMATHDRAFT_2771 [Amanita thiersii Skay4041]